MAPLYILTETSAGFALFQAKDKKILKNEALAQETETAEGICNLLKLREFQKFDSAATALEEIASLVEGKVTPMLAKLLEPIQTEKKAVLAVADSKLGNSITKLPGLTIAPVSDSATNELFRSIRGHLPSLIPGLLPENISTMSLGLSHSLSRHKLKFSPDKVDIMIVQAIALLDDMDKELNTYAMRVKEWYGWHFPEMGRIVNDNLAYAKVILAMGMKSAATTADLSDILPEEIEAAVKAAAEVSMGTEIDQVDLYNIKLLAEQVVGFTEYRQQLSSYLSARMLAIAPNLTELVGDLVGARLIAHAGSLMQLAKSPASTIQILGAEKALFRALKTKHDTPKYGLIYHASLVGQATGKNKGKIARMLAAKSAIGIRVDALSTWSAQGEGKGDDVEQETRASLGVDSRAKLESRLRALEGKPLLTKGVALGPNGKAVATPKKWEVKEARKYNPDADGLAGDEPAAVVKEKKEKNGKKEKGEAKVKKALIEEVKEVRPESEASDVDESDEEMGEDTIEPIQEFTKKTELEDPVVWNGLGESKAAANLKSNGGPLKSDDHSDTIGTVSPDSPDSPDSPTQQEINWQSPILGNTKEAKKARKIERHERKLALSADRAKERAQRNAKIERRLDRKERRLKKAEQVERREERDEQKYGKLAKLAGISINKYKRKLERGDIEVGADGIPKVIHKRDKKKQAAKSGVSNGVEESGKKRKREGEAYKSEKKKKKESIEA